MSSAHVRTMMDESSSWTLTVGATGLLTVGVACGLREVLLRLPMRLASTGGSLELSVRAKAEPCWDAVSMGSTYPSSCVVESCVHKMCSLEGRDRKANCCQ